MPFPQATVDTAWIRSGGMCECQRASHIHFGRCFAQLSYGNRGRVGQGAWEANHKHRVEAGGSDALSNCEILCWACHRATF